MSPEAKLDLPLWHWTTETGEPQHGDEQELVRQLASGQAPPYVLVWREGWAEWLPALEVEELSAAFAEAPPSLPRRARPSTLPGMPPIPVREYPRLRLLAKSARPSRIPQGPSEVSHVGVAVPYACPEEDVSTTEVPLDALAEAARMMTHPTPPADLGLEAAVERASAFPDATTPISRRASRRTTPPPAPPSSRPAPPLAAELGFGELLDTGAPKPFDGPAWLRRNGIWIALCALLLGLAGSWAVRRVAPQLFETAPIAPASSASTSSASR